MLVAKVLSLAVLAGTAVADGDSILAAIDLISNDTRGLQAEVNSWDGGLLGALPIVVKSTTLLNNINDGTDVAKASAPLTTAEAIRIASATLNLVSTVNETLGTIVATKPKFDELFLGPVILLNLKLEQSASNDFSRAVVEKVPAALQPTAAQLTKQIDDAFVSAIDVYNPF